MASLRGQKYGSMGPGRHYLDDHLCKSCEKIINRHKNKYLIETNSVNVMLEKIYESMGQIKRDINDMKERLCKTEKYAEEIKKNIMVNDEESNNGYNDDY
jgi:Na+/phosphate symporter